MIVIAPDFEQAMTTATFLSEAWERGEISDEVLADKVGELVTSREGVRGFFVVTMSGDCPLLDRLPEPLLMQLRGGGEEVVDITVRNLAMSSAMALHHERNSDKKQQEGSERVTSRCIELLRLLDPNIVKTRLEKLLAGIEGKGDDVRFLSRWNFDNKQRIAIHSNVISVAKNKL